MWTRVGENEQYIAVVYNQHDIMATTESYVFGEFVANSVVAGSSYWPLNFQC